MDKKNTVTLDLDTYDSYKRLENELKEAKELLDKKHVVTISGGPFIYTSVYTDDEAVKILSKKLSENETELKKNILELKATKTELKATKRKLETKEELINQLLSKNKESKPSNKRFLKFFFTND